VRISNRKAITRPVSTIAAERTNCPRAKTPLRLVASAQTPAGVLASSRVRTPPPIWEKGEGKGWGDRAWAHWEKHGHLPLGHLHPLVQPSAQRPLREPGHRVQAALDGGGIVVEMADEEL